MRSIAGLAPTWSSRAAKEDHVHPGGHQNVVVEDVGPEPGVAVAERAIGQQHVPFQRGAKGTLILQENKLPFAILGSLDADNPDH